MRTTTTARQAMVLLDYVTRNEVGAEGLRALTQRAAQIAKSHNSPVLGLRNLMQACYEAVGQVDGQAPAEAQAGTPEVPAPGRDQDELL
jgi:hypothetical protein